METSANPTHSDLVGTGQQTAHGGVLFRWLSGGRREVVFWTLQTAFWAALGGIGVMMTLAFHSAVADVDGAILLRIANGFVLTTGLRGIYFQPWFRQRSSILKWSLAATCCMALGLLEMLILHAVMAAGIALPGGEETGGLRLMMVRFFVLGLWSALYFAFHLFEDQHALEMRAARAELAAREYELRHLQAQMCPHFVLNALNGVLACKDDPVAVGDVTQSLVDYLQFLLREAPPLEPLAREIGALEKLFTVQAFRFKGDLLCRIYADSAACAMMVPPMMIQPLLENAFLHRPEGSDQPLHIWVTARIEGGFLKITVSHTGQWTAPASIHQPSNGIVALRQRLKLLLGPQAQVNRQVEDGWIRLMISIPVPDKATQQRDRREVRTGVA